MSKVVVFVLDTRLGRPAQGISVRLERRGKEDPCEKIAEGVTDDDGSIERFLDPGLVVSPGFYRLTRI